MTVSHSPGGPLVALALTVGAALHRAGIRAVLTGGACAAMYTDGAYVSQDIDFIIQSAPTQAALDTAMASIGFTRGGDRYVNPATNFYVEFPPGPLAVGAEAATPIEITGPAGTLLTLSATDMAKDRLAAYLHWHDQQSLELAVHIARLNDVDMAEIKRWSRREGAQEEFEAFRRHALRIV